MASFGRRYSALDQALGLLIALVIVGAVEFWLLPDQVYLRIRALFNPSGPIADRLSSAEHTTGWSDVSGLLGDVIGTGSSRQGSTVHDLASLKPLLDQAGFRCGGKVSHGKRLVCSNPGAGWTAKHCRREWNLVLNFDERGRQGSITGYTARVQAVCDTARSLAS